MEPRASSPAATLSVARKFHVLVGVTGSVAALKLPLLISKLLDVPGVSILSRQAWRPLASVTIPGASTFLQDVGFLFP
jgi:hypothetical protein